MKVGLSDIIACENKVLAKQVEIELLSLDLRVGKFPILKKAPFVLTFTNVENRKLLIQGETQVTIEFPCDRCLAEVAKEFCLTIDREIDLTDQEEENGMEETDYMIGTELDVDQLIFGEILVRWPMKVLCKDDCKGICKRCGANLNITECQCQKTEPDPRMAAIQDIFNKFKEV